MKVDKVKILYRDRNVWRVVFFAYPNGEVIELEVTDFVYVWEVLCKITTL